MSKTVLVNVEAAGTIPLDELVPFQDDLKSISKEEYERLRQSIIDEGITLSLHVWAHKKSYHLIDGHQRVFTLKKMRNDEGFEIPDIPVSMVKARSFKDAKRKVLIAASVSGKVSKDAFEKYLSNHELTIEEILSKVNLPGVDMQKVIEKMQQEVDETMDKMNNNIPSSSEQVRQVQLFFNSENHEEFVTKINALSIDLGTENITDTVMECVRENYKAHHGPN